MPDFLPDEIRSASVTRQSNSRKDLPDGNLKNFIDANLQPDSSDLYAATLEMMERCLLTRVLRATCGNQSKSAELWGITRGSLRSKIHALGISIDQNISVPENPSES